MSTQLKLRRGTTAQHSTFTGAEGEITVDTTKDTVVVHDGATAGGFPLAKETGSALSPTSVTMSSGTANGVAYLNGSKVLTTGSALTFDGTNLSIAGSNALKASAIGTTVQAYDANLAAFANKTAPSGAVVGTTDTQTLTNKTVIGPSGNFTTLQENSLPVVQQSDIGTAPNEVPVNGMLGALAFTDTVMTSVPASATAAGTKGQIAEDGSYLYICTAANTWKRVAITTW